MICSFLLLRNVGHLGIVQEKRECFLYKVRPSFDKIRNVYRPWHPFCVEGAAISGLYRKRIFPPLLDLLIVSWDLQRSFPSKNCLGFSLKSFSCKIVNLLSSKHVWYRKPGTRSANLRKSFGNDVNLFTSKHIYVRQEAWYQILFDWQS